jgi:hypothetical protein
MKKESDRGLVSSVEGCLHGRAHRPALGGRWSFSAPVLVLRVAVQWLVGREERTRASTFGTSIRPACRRHDVAFSYRFVKESHRWLALVPDTCFTLVAVVDDATKQLLHAELHAGGESVAAVMTALRAVVERYGLPAALYTERAHWAVHTLSAGSAPDGRRLTQVGRALARLGIEHILGYSPQARGRSERVNRTRQDRLVNELRLAGVGTLAAANRYLRERRAVRAGQSGELRRHAGRQGPPAAELPREF